MPDTAERKRQRRAERSAATGKSYKPRKHPCLRQQPPPPVDGSVAPQETRLSTQEEMERARMEVEDCRVHMKSAMQASASLLSFYATWLQPGQLVRLRPHYEHLLQLLPKERGILHRLDRQDARGLWRLSGAEGPRKGKALFTDVPPKALMP